jgi:hypothetical protein
MNRERIVVVPYNPDWPRRFEARNSWTSGLKPKYEAPVMPTRTSKLETIGPRKTSVPRDGCRAGVHPSTSTSTIHRRSETVSDEIAAGEGVGRAWVSPSCRRRETRRSDLGSASENANRGTTVLQSARLASGAPRPGSAFSSSTAVSAGPSLAALIDGDLRDPPIDLPVEVHRDHVGGDASDIILPSDYEVCLTHEGSLVTFRRTSG